MNRLKHPTDQSNEDLEYGFVDESYNDPRPEAPFTAYILVDRKNRKVNIVPFLPEESKGWVYKVQVDGNKQERIIDYKLGGEGWIEKGTGATPLSKAIGEAITAHFGG